MIPDRITVIPDQITVIPDLFTVAELGITVIPDRIIMIPGRITVIRPLPTVGRCRPHDKPAVERLAHKLREAGIVEP